MTWLIEGYWKPVYHAARHHVGVTPEEARDLTQEFFLHILEGGVLPGVDRDKGSFRHYLKGALRNFLLNKWRKGKRLKRGGGEKVIRLDFESIATLPVEGSVTPEEALDREWGMQILKEAVEELEAGLERDGRAAEVPVFRAYELGDEDDRPTYEELGARFGMTASDVEAILKGCRRRLRRLLLQKTSVYVRTEVELVRELRELFGF